MSAFYNVDQPPFNMGSVARAIAAANNGLLFDPSDMSTLYQDAAGTIPVTTVEQPVGKIIDKSGNGNHATQSVTASRPVLSARKNVLLATETLATQSVTSIASQYTLSFTGTGSVTLSGTATGTLTGTGTGRVSLTVTPTAGTLTLTVSGSVTKAQLELGTSAGPYQRVNTATDYDTDERYFPKYLRFDGIDDYLNLPWMNLAGSTAGTTTIVAMDSRYTGTNVSYVLSEKTTYKPVTVYGPMYLANGLPHRVFMMKDDLQLLNTGYSVRSDRANVFSVTDDMTNITQRKNGVIANQVAFSHPALITDNTLIGAGNHGGIVSNFGLFNLYGMIITKSALTDAQRIACERHVARKAGVQL